MLIKPYEWQRGYNAAEEAHKRGQCMEKWKELAESSPDFNDFDRGVIAYCNSLTEPTD